MINDPNAERRFWLAENLLSNAVSCIHHVADRLSENYHGIYYDDQPLKTSLSLVQNSLECLLKSRLAWYDWKLVVHEPKNLTDTKFKDGDFKTIGFSDACKLLKKPPFEINLSRLKSKQLFELRDSRHKQTHYFLDLSIEKCVELLAYGLDFCLEFYNDHIFKSFFEEKNRFKDIDIKLKKIPVYTNVRINSAKKNFPDLKPPLTAYFDCCTNCEQTAPVINSPYTVMCLYCLQEDDIEYIAGNVGRIDKQVEVKDCPECLYHSMGALNLTHDPESWQCVVCGYFTNQPQYFNFVPGGLLKKYVGKPEKRKEIRWKMLST